MLNLLNQSIASRLEEVSKILAEQGANRFRVQAYQRAASAVRELSYPVSEIFDIGKISAWKLYEDLGIESLDQLEAAASDGRLEKFAGIGPKRLAGIRDTLAQRLGRIRQRLTTSVQHNDATVAELLDVDRQYREQAASGALQYIAPRRFNPLRKAWLPILHTVRGPRHYTAVFSNTARAHEFNKTHDWVVLFYDGSSGEHQCTVITSGFGHLQGKRIVRGREQECQEYYLSTRSRSEFAPAQVTPYHLIPNGNRADRSINSLSPNS